MNNNKDFYYALILSHQCMRILGIWPDPNVPINVFRRPNIKFILIASIISLYVFTPQIINVIRAWGNVTRTVEFFVGANFSLMALCKMIITRYHCERLRTLIASFMTDWMISKNSWEQSTMLKLAKSGRSISFGYFIIVISTLIFGILQRFMVLFKNIHQPRRYLFYRFDYIQKSPNYEITCFLQIFGGTYAVLSNYSVDTFISILMLQICAQLINLRITLNNLIDQLSNKSISSSKFKEGLSAIIIRHKHLIRNVKTIDDCYNTVLLLHLFAATLQLCLVTFRVFTIITDNANISLFQIIFLMFYVCLVVMQLYIYCYAAERLLTESTNMAYGVYVCKWYNIPTKNAKDLMMIVYRSTISLKLTAGKFGNFSLEMFEIAVKTSMGYLSVLLTIRE